MSGELVKELMDPATTLDALLRVPISTSDLEKNRLAPKERRDAMNNLLLAYEHVPAASRICYFDIRPFPGTAERRDLVIEPQAKSTNFKSGLVFKTAKRLPSLFYLPYRKNGTTRMKLDQPDDWAGGEVKFFATAAIDGCSVYIEGPAHTPKVTHANAANVQPTLATDTYAQKQPKILAKSQAMDARVQFVRKTAVTVVERPDYMVEAPAQVHAAKQQFALRKGIPIVQVQSYMPFGAVMGVKSGGLWTFYMQKSGAFQYTPALGGDVLDGYMVLGAREVYPNGGGAVRIIP